MSNSGDSRPTVMFWVISFVLLLWGLAGVSIYVGYFIEGPDDFASSAESTENAQAYADYIANIPIWAIAVGVIAALARLLGAIGLFARRTWALPLYVLALIFFLIAMFRAFVLADVASVMSAWHIGIEIAFAVLSIYAVCFSYKMKSRGVLT